MFRVVFQAKSQYRARICRSQDEVDEYKKKHPDLFVQPMQELMPERFINQHSRAKQNSRTDKCKCGRNKVRADEFCVSCSNKNFAMTG